ncbi:hypothetical protein PG984_003404 [Apiospora sp. TS-2023a]
MGPTYLVRNDTVEHKTVVPRFSEVTAPTLIYNGKHDTSQDAAKFPFFELIPSIRWVTNLGGEARERTWNAVGELLAAEGDQVNIKTAAQ